MRPIIPINNNGSIQLKFSVKGKRYSFNPIPGGHYANARDLSTAIALTTRIHNDVLANNFDPTLDRYRLVVKAAPTPLNKATKLNSLLELWDRWVASLNLSEATRCHHYRAIRSHIAKVAPETLQTEWLASAKLSPVTYNRRLSYLHACFRWAMTTGLVSENPYTNLKPRKVSKAELKPFSLQELSKIVEGFRQLQPHYLPFVTFLILTGVRLSEAIGLHWRDVDFAKSVITIAHSLSIDKAGNGYRRILKETKTGSIRHLEMSESLRALLEPIKQHPDALVFTTPHGKVIDHVNFRNRYWKTVLEAQSIPYRKPHNLRHTLLSHAIEQGVPLTGVAYLAGHADTRMVMQTYGHMINRPSLPDLPL